MSTAIDQNDGQLAIDSGDLVRSSKRKRKHPSGMHGMEQDAKIWTATAKR